MAESTPYGTVLLGEDAAVSAAWQRFDAQPVDLEMPDREPGYSALETTLGRAVSATGPGTFFGRAQRTLAFHPAREGGWRFDRTDLGESMPIAVCPANIWTTVRNIVLACGSPHNYMRMVEHIIALRSGLGVDHVVIRMDSGDPPLFERSSMPLVEAFDAAGLVELDRPAQWVTVREPVTVAAPNGSFLTFLPAEDGQKRLSLDCAIHFPTAIGRQRIRFDVSPRTFRHGAQARTNTTFMMMLYVKTLGKLFADTRHLGYSTRNILVAGRRRYINPPLLMHNGKSLEAAWHRATLDLLAAVAMIDRGRFCGRILSYKAGHALDCRAVQALGEGDWLVPV
jgi:UDP-3-O-acyl-N-acetylglucosamine deacetylase